MKLNNAIASVGEWEKSEENVSPIGMTDFTGQTFVRVWPNNFHSVSNLLKIFEQIQ